MYPGLFDIIPAWLEDAVDVDRYILRHRVNAVFGWVGIVFTGRLASRLFGPWSGILAVILLTVSPQLLRRFDEQPKGPAVCGDERRGVVLPVDDSLPAGRISTVGTGAEIAVALGLALATRPGGLLYFGYLPLLHASRSSS